MVRSAVAQVYMARRSLFSQIIITRQSQRQQWDVHGLVVKGLVHALKMRNSSILFTVTEFLVKFPRRTAKLRMEVLERGHTSIMKSPAWDSIPLLALKCILEHLELKDVLNAVSTCQHWRSAMLIYEGHRDCLKLHVKEDIKKHELLTRFFKKHTRILQIFMNSEATEMELNKFMCYILPQFLDSINLQEIVFIGPIYMSQDRSTPYAQLRRVILETLVFKHAHTLEKLAVFGCGINIVDDDDRYTSRHMAYYSKPLSFHAFEYSSATIHENLILSRNNVNIMMFSNINHIVFEYELISTDALITLSKLDNLKMLSFNIISKQRMKLPRVEWGAVTPLFSKGLEVGVNIISLPPHKVKHVIDNAFSEGMPLISLKVMFCEIFYSSLVQHITEMYHKTLMEFSWADRPTIAERHRRLIKQLYNWDVNASYHNVNPFIFLTWQCKQLRKLTIHGYWMCEYDLIGITRLREDIALDVSAVYDSRSDRLEPHRQGCVERVTTRNPPHCHHKVYQYRKGSSRNYEVKCRYWTDMPAGLKAESTPAERAEYIVSEVMQPFGDT